MLRHIKAESPATEVDRLNPADSPVHQDLIRRIPRLAAPRESLSQEDGAYPHVGLHRFLHSVAKVEGLGDPVYHQGLQSPLVLQRHQFDPCSRGGEGDLLLTPDRCHRHHDRRVGAECDQRLGRALVTCKIGVDLGSQNRLGSLKRGRVLGVRWRELRLGIAHEEGGDP